MRTYLLKKIHFCLIPRKKNLNDNDKKRKNNIDPYG